MTRRSGRDSAVAAPLERSGAACGQRGRGGSVDSPRLPSLVRILISTRLQVDWLRPLATSSIKLKPVFSARKAAQVPVRVPVVERAQAARKKAEEEKKKVSAERQAVALAPCPPLPTSQGGRAGS